MLTEQQFVLRLEALDADALAHYRAADTADERAAWLQIANAIGEAMHLVDTVTPLPGERQC